MAKNYTTNINRKRVILAFSLIMFALSGLLIRMGWIQIVNAQKYSDMAQEQQTKDIPITAKRGNIYDRNNKAMAISTVKYTVWVRPSDVNNLEKDSPGFASRMANVLGAILTDQTPDQILEKITNNKNGLLRVAKYQEKETAQLIRQAIADKSVAGISLTEDVTRYYPMGAFASHVLGSTNDDNNGMSGMELKYDQFLRGTPGRWIKSTDGGGRNLTRGVEKYYPAENGLNLVLTIDEIIQHYTEKALETVQANTQAERVMAIVMDPKTSEILAMAMTPEFDPNNPRVPLDEEKATYVDQLTPEEKLEFWNEMWRNPMVSDTYEPGSTFKLITTAIALEEGAATLNDTFVCRGGIQVQDRFLKCAVYPNAHGAQTLTEAVMHSCNPAQVMLSDRVGKTKYIEDLRLFGFANRTGIDFPGEAYAIIQAEKNIGPVELATMSYGQGIAVTPIQLLTTVCAIVNDGKLIQPRLVKSLVDDEGKIVENFESEVVRQIISEKTSEEMRGIMQSVVTGGGGKTAYIPGYRLGGKTGTANKVIDGKYSTDTYSSFVGVAPMDDPQVAVLVIVDSPKGVHYGSQTAGPGVKAIMEDTLRYLNVEPVYTAEELASQSKEKVTVPDVTGKDFATAKKILKSSGLGIIVSPERSEEEEFTIIDQYPKAGEVTPYGNSVTVYWE